MWGGQCAVALKAGAGLSGVQVALSYLGGSACHFTPPAESLLNAPDSRRYTLAEPGPNQESQSSGPEMGFKQFG